MVVFRNEESGRVEVDGISAARVMVFGTIATRQPLFVMDIVEREFMVCLGVDINNP